MLHLVYRLDIIGYPKIAKSLNLELWLVYGFWGLVDCWTHSFQQSFIRVSLRRVALSKPESKELFGIVTRLFEIPLVWVFLIVNYLLLRWLHFNQIVHESYTDLVHKGGSTPTFFYIYLTGGITIYHFNIYTFLTGWSR